MVDITLTTCQNKKAKYEWMEQVILDDLDVIITIRVNEPIQFPGDDFVTQSAKMFIDAYVYKRVFVNLT